MSFINLFTFEPYFFFFFEFSLDVLFELGLRSQFIVLFLKLSEVFVHPSEVFFKLLHVTFFVIMHLFRHLISYLINLNMNKFILRIYFFFVGMIDLIFVIKLFQLVFLKHFLSQFVICIKSVDFFLISS